MIKAIIFDFAGMIGSDGYWVWLREVVPNIDVRKPFFAELADKVDKGLVDNTVNIKTLSQETGVPVDQIWKQIYAKIIINSELVNYIKALKKKYLLGLLSNYTYPWLEEILEKHHLYPLFDAVIISSRHKILKPERQAFQIIFNALHVSPEEVIFIDDRQNQVESAIKIGIKSILFTTNEKLRQDLEILGVKV